MMCLGFNVKLYTSNYARKGKNSNAISISRSVPPWYSGMQIKELAPTWEMIYGHKDGSISDKMYTEMYLDLLEKQQFDIEHLIDTLRDNSTLETEYYFLCYEKPTDFCHRRILAGIIEEGTGIRVPEWMNESERKKHEEQEFVDSILGF